MSTIKDGGPAFPLTIANDSEETVSAFGVSVLPESIVQFTGLSAREYFAAHASDKDIDDIIFQSFQDGHPNGSPPTRQHARYIHADLMLAAREVEK